MEETIATPFLGRAWRLHSYGITKASVAWMQTDRLDAASFALCQSWHCGIAGVNGMILLLKDIKKTFGQECLAWSSENVLCVA